MGKTRRLCLVVASVAGLLGVGFLAVLWFGFEPLLPAAFWLMGQSWFEIVEAVLLGIVAVGFVAALVYAIAAPGTHSRLTDKRERGTIAIDKKALETTTRSAIERHSGLEARAVKVDLSGTGARTRIRIKAKVDSGSTTNLTALGSQLQNEVIVAVETLTGRVVDRVGIDFVGGHAPTAQAAIIHPEPAHAPQAAAAHA